MRENLPSALKYNVEANIYVKINFISHVVKYLKNNFDTLEYYSNKFK